MRAIDLTHVIEENMPVFPGTEPPRLAAANTIELDGFSETLLTMVSHTGTHMDAPRHLFHGLRGLDDMEADAFAGRGLVIDCSDLKEGGRVGMDRVRRYGATAEQAEFLLFRFGWDVYWKTKRYFADFPCITEETARYMIDAGKKGIGLDTISVDPLHDTNLSLHKMILPANRMVIIENLTNLGAIGEGLFTFLALPLKFRASDGAPVRAMALLS